MLTLEKDDLMACIESFLTFATHMAIWPENGFKIICIDYCTPQKCYTVYNIIRLFINRIVQ